MFCHLLVIFKKVHTYWYDIAGINNDDNDQSRDVFILMFYHTNYHSTKWK